LAKKKKKSKYRLVNVAMEINKITIRDANLSPSVNEFFEEFADYIVALLINFFSGYNYVEFAKESRDLTAFITPLKLLRMTILF